MSITSSHFDPTALRWAIYCRKSDDDRKVTEKSIAEQMKEARLIAERDALLVVWQGEESKSAKVPGVRPLFNDLLKKIEKGEVNGILCWHVNRLARNMAEGGMLAHLMAEGKLKEIRTPTSVFKTGDNIIPLVVETGTSTQYSLEVVRNVSRGFRGHFERGGTTYKAPAGYRNARDPENTRRGIVVKDEPRFSLIQRGFEMYLRGGYTVSQVRTTLNEEWGYRSRPTAKAGGKPLSPAHAYNIFRDPFYAGFVRFKGELVKGTHEPMLTHAQFAQVQEILNRQTRRVQKAKIVRTYAFTGLMRCAYCGQQVTADTRLMRNGKPYVSYHCSDSWRKCTKRGMSHKQLDLAFAEELARIQVDERLVKEALANIKRALKAKYRECNDERERHNTDVGRLNRKLYRAREMYLDGLVNDEREYRQMIEATRADLQKSLFRSESTTLTFDEACESAENAARFIWEARRVFLSGNNDKKREIVSALATGCTFYGKEKRIEFDLDSILASLMRYSKSLSPALKPAPSQPEVRAGISVRFHRLEPTIIGSGTMKNTPAREAFFVGGTNENSHEDNCGEATLLDKLVELLCGRMFPNVCAEAI
jgi:DNA invertase Pin-like site-specific DNA recombinase